MPATNRPSASGTRLTVRVALTGGLALVAIAVIVVLSSSPLIVAGTSSTPSSTPALPITVFAASGATECHSGGTMPQGTSAIRISIVANIGPRVTLTGLSGPLLTGLSAPMIITHGEREAGWGLDKTVTVSVKRVPRAIPNTEICISFGQVLEVNPIKEVVQTTTAGGTSRQAVRFRVEYLRPGRRSWWSLASSVVQHMGLGHAPGGTWIVVLLIALMITVATLASQLILRTATGRCLAGNTSERALLEPSAPAPAAETGALARWGQATRRRAAHWWPADGRAEQGRKLTRASLRVWALLRRIPRAAWICALVACLNAACWSLITPPFQLPDEPSHFAYVQQLAETGTLPTSSNGDWSQEEQVALRDLRQAEVRGSPQTHTIATQAEQGRLQHDLSLPLPRSGGGGAGVAANQPPLFYALQTIPYFLGSSGTLLDRLELMRLLSALMAGLTALFVYLFVREALPGAPWAWAVGGAAVALMPLLGFMSGAVNPDAMLFAVSAATFYLFARAFRRGLTPRLAIAIGLVTTIGLLTKVNFVGLTPGIGVGLVALTFREARISRGTAYRSLALALAIPAAPVCVYLVINLLSNHPALGVVSGAIHLTSGRGSLIDEISYIWQFYLPRLPGMTTYFPGISTTLQLWFDRSVGLYGWLDTPFPPWVEHIALIPAVLLALLGIRELITIRATVRRRLVELAVYAVMGVGLLALIGADQYLTYLAREAQPETYAEPRYLLPLLALLGAALVLSARGAGRRWGPPVGTLIVVLFLTWNVFSQLQVISRFYG